MFVSQIIDEASEVLATSDKNKIFRKLQQAVQALMESGHWFHTNAEVDVCTGWDGQTITLPKDIEVPLAVNVDGSPTYFRGRLFQYHVNKGGMYNPVSWAWDDRGFVSTLMDIRQPSQLVAVAEHEADAGVKLRIVGTDSDNRALRDQLEDGTGVDGMLITTHAQSDYAFGTITPDGVTIQTREVTVDPFIRLAYSSPTTVPTFSAGQAVTATALAGVFPPPLVAGETYYTGAYLTGYVTLHRSSLDAINGLTPIRFQNVGSSSSITLTNARSIALNTIVSLDTYPTITVGSPTELTFGLKPSGGATILPSPLIAGAAYFAVPIESISSGNLSFKLYNSLSDANSGLNSINLLGGSGGDKSFYTQIRKPVAPQTTLTISTASTSYSNGDEVQAYTNGGTLPEPLIAGQTYYVYGVNSSNVTLHLNYADSLTGKNPITLTTAGVGQNSIAKLLPATANPGTKNNISVSGLTLPAPAGSGATAIAYASGPVTSTTLASAGTGYSSATATFSDLGGYNYNATPTISISGGTYSSLATATANLSTDAASGKQYVSSITMVSNGAGYTTANPPTVTFIGGLNPGGVAAKGTPIISGGQVTGITLTPFGAGAAANVSVNTITNVVNGLSLVNPGSGYIFPPRVAFSASNLIPTPSITIITGSATARVSIILYQYSETGEVIDLNPISFSVGPSSTYTNTTTFAAAIAASVNSYMSSAGYAVATANVITFPGAVALGRTIAKILNTAGTAPVVEEFPTTAYWVTATASCAITTSFVDRYEITSGGSLYSNVPAVTLSGGGGTGATASAVTDSSGVTGVTLTSGGGGYPSTVTASITDSTGTGSGATALVSVLSGVITQVIITNPGSGYTTPVITFSGSPSTAAVVALTKGYVVTGIKVITQGTGYTSAPAVALIASTGYFVQFSSTGVMPTPLLQGNSYRAEGPSTSGSFTVKNADFSDVEITSTGSGSLYCVVSRSFGVGFTTLWEGDFAGLSTGQVVYLGTDYQLPITTPSTSAGVAYYLSKTSDTSAYLFTDVGLSTKVVPVALGSGQSYYAVQYSSTAKAYLNRLTPTSLEGLSNGLGVTFAPSTALPYPLVSTQTYYILMQGADIVLTTNGTTVVEFVNAGVPTLASNVFTLNLTGALYLINSTSLNVYNGLIETGVKVTVRGGDDGSLPSPLVATTYTVPQNYYARRVTSSQIELYPSESMARNLASTTGRVVYTTSGSTVDSYFFVDAVYEPTIVKGILHVEKPVTQGYISLYAFDYGRSNELCLIGQYHPSETNPKYRRIRIGMKCAWARILYRVKCPEITSVYDYIPLENTRAVLLALHAVDLEDKDFMEQAQKYWGMAIQYLKNQQESMDGHAMQVPQISGITYGDVSDDVMF